MEIFDKIKIKNRYIYICSCPYCGNIINIRADHFKERKRDDCGCLNHNDARNGKHNKLYDIHQAIKQRCLNKNQKHYNRYGGRGIKICDEWVDYLNFKSWALNNGYKEGYDIDRIDNNGNYEPDNCRFITRKENCNNRENTVKIEYKNKIYTISSLANEFGIARNIIVKRYYRGKRGDDLVAPPKYKNSYTN